MMGLLADIVARWGATPALQSLVPSDRVILGEPILGWPVPSVAWSGYLRAKRTQGSRATADTVTLRCHCVADTADAVEQIVDAILTHLLPLTSGSHTLPTWESYTLEVARDPTSEQYSGTLSMTCHIWES